MMYISKEVLYLRCYERHLSAYFGKSITQFTLFQPSVAFHIETSHLISSANQITGFYMKCSQVSIWNATVSWNGLKLIVSIASGVSLRFTPCYKNMLNYGNDNNAENLRHCKSRFSLIVEQKLAFALSSNLVWEGKNLSPNFNWIA